MPPFLKAGHFRLKRSVNRAVRSAGNGDHFIWAKLFFFLGVLWFMFVAALPVYSGFRSPVILELEDYTQPNVFYCGPTAIYLVMNYWGLENIDFKYLANFLFQKEVKGTANSSMMFCPRLFGLKSYSFTGHLALLKGLLDQKIPVIVLQDLSKHIKLGHYRIVVGMNSHQNRILLRDPGKKKIRKMKLDRFIRLWERGNNPNNHQWAMILLPSFIDFSDESVKNSVLTDLNIGTYYYRHFDYPNAFEAFKKAYDKDRKNQDVLKYYAQVLIRLKNYDQATGIINELISLDPRDPVAYDLMGLTLFYTGHYEQALNNLTLAKELNPDPNENTFIINHYNLVKKFIEDRQQNDKKN